jgi:CRP-like cAMP-binding protein
VTTDDLRGLELFAGVSEEGLARVAECAGMVECEPGQVLALPGDPGSGMFVILDGTVAIETRGSSIELHRSNFVGELALLNPETERVARVRAATDVRALAIPRDEALALIESEPAFALTMLRELARRLASAMDPEAS